MGIKSSQVYGATKVIAGLTGAWTKAFMMLPTNTICVVDNVLSSFADGTSIDKAQRCQARGAVLMMHKDITRIGEGLQLMMDVPENERLYGQDLVEVIVKAID